MDDAVAGLDVQVHNLGGSLGGADGDALTVDVVQAAGHCQTSTTKSLQGRRPIRDPAANGQTEFVEF